MGTRQMSSGTIVVNGTELYHEVRGDGPPLLLIAGGLADAGQFAALGDALAERCTVITYDRRGNSRSRAPEGWAATSIDEQADDAAALLQALDIPAASVYGHSIGAAIALGLALRRPEIVHALAVQDPVLLSVLADPGAAVAAIGSLVAEHMQAGGPAAAADAFFRFAVGSAVEHLERATYERMVGNGAVLFGIEFEALSGWRPDEEALRRSLVPVLMLTGIESPPFFQEAAGWLATRLGGTVEQVPGGHGAPFDHATAVAQRVAQHLAGVRA